MRAPGCMFAHRPTQTLTAERASCMIWCRRWNTSAIPEMFRNARQRRDAVDIPRQLGQIDHARSFPVPRHGCLIAAGALRGAYVLVPPDQLARCLGGPGRRLHVPLGPEPVDDQLFDSIAAFGQFGEEVIAILP